MLDHVTDTTLRGLHAIQTVFVIPDFVKEAEATSAETAAGLRTDQFADPDNRRFPIHTKADTWLSVAYLNSQMVSPLDKTAEKNNLPKIQENLRNAVEFWNLNASFAPKPGVQKEAAVETPVMTLKFQTGTEKEASVQVMDFGQYKEAAEQLLKLRHEYPYLVRRDVARQILDNQTLFSEKLAEDTLTGLHKTAGLTVGDLPSVTMSLRERGVWYERSKTKYAVDAVQSLLKEASETPKDNPVLLHETMDKIAAVVDTLDRMASLPVDKGYTSLLPAPEDMGKSLALNQLEKLGSSMTELPDGSVVFNHKVASKASDIRKWFRETRSTDLSEGNLLDKLAEQHPSDIRILMQVFGDDMRTP